MTSISYILIFLYSLYGVLKLKVIQVGLSIYERLYSMPSIDKSD
jgi:hypothetical protein